VHSSPDVQRPQDNVNPPQKPKFNIKRIKLLVRRPPPTVSNPRQRLPAPRYGASLEKFLSSYKILSGQDQNEAALERSAHHDAAILERIDEFRRQGRLLLSADGLAACGVSSAPNGKHTSAVIESKRDPDAWDHVMYAVTAQARTRKSHGRHVAAQIASKVQAYWDGYAAKKDKAKMQEEKRLRALAKSTVRMVTNEWKKAVFVCDISGRGFLSDLMVFFCFLIAYSGTRAPTNRGRGNASRTRALGRYSGSIRAYIGDAARGPSEGRPFSNVRAI
jgi:helicase SWR1